MTDVAEVAAAAKTLGQALDADVASVKAKLVAAEARLTKLETGAVAWVKTNWPHFVTWLTVVGAPYVLSHVKLL